jgi:hypothetical protein
MIIKNPKRASWRSSYTMPRDWKSWLKTNAPVSSFEASVGSTGWFDGRRRRDQAKAWIRNMPAKRSLESDDEDDQEAEGD